MDIDVQTNGPVAILSVTGRIDTLSAPDFQKKMEEVLAQGQTKIVIDLANVAYVSSAGLRSFLIGAQKAKTSGGTFCCCALQGMVQQVFEISGFARMIKIFDCVEAALQ